MALQVGLVGLPNVGKSTLFNALTNAGAMVANYPFTTIDPNVGVVPGPDPRLDEIAAIVQPQEATPTTLRVVDIAGLVKGASHGEGLGNQFLGHIRNVDAIAMVVRCFDDPEIPHVTADLDPAGDVETIELELALADMATVERRIEAVRDASKGRPREHAHEIAAMESIRERLERGEPLRAVDLDEHEVAQAQALSLLTAKPRLYVANVDEDGLPEGGALVQRVREVAQAEGASVVAICASLEADLAAGWSADEAAEYLAELGLGSSCLGRFIRSSYDLLDLITFFTTVGGKQVRAWTLPRGQTALQAAGQIHTDMAKGFIRAEVAAYDDLTEQGSYAQLREHGLVRIEGRDYVVADGDILHIRFNV
jgi:ribosome-binding ATPase